MGEIRMYLNYLADRKETNRTRHIGFTDKREGEWHMEKTMMEKEAEKQKKYRRTLQTLCLWFVIHNVAWCDLDTEWEVWSEHDANGQYTD